MRTQPLVEETDDADAGNRGIDGEIGRGADADEQWPRRLDPHHLAGALELPRRHRAAAEAATQARVLEELARMLGTTVAIEVGGSCSSRKALRARTDRHRDHVLLQSLVITDSSVEPGTEDIDEAILGDHLQTNLRISCEKARHDPRKDKPHGADRHIEPECARGLVAESIHHIESRLHFGQRGRESLKQPLAGFGGGDASRRSVKEPDAELRFQSAHRFAEAGRTRARGARSLAKAAGAADTAHLVSMPAGPIAGLSFDAAQNIYVANDTTIEEVTAGPVVSTLAGTAGVHGSADGQGSAAEFGCVPFYYGANLIGTTGATAIATLPSGTSYVADYCHNTIRKVTSTGAVTTFAGAAGVIGAKDGTGQAALFFQPAGLVLDPSGNLFVADYYNALIRKITPGGVVTTVAGQTPHLGHADGSAAQATFCVPFGVVADAAGNLYVTDTFNYVIRKITPAGSVTTLAGIPGTPGFANGPGQSATFAYPQNIAIDADGNLYVTDLLNEAVRKVTPAGVVSTFVGAGFFTQPAGVAVDAAGNVYITDHTGIYEAGPSGGAAVKIASLSGATAITVAPSGTLYITAGHPFTSDGAGAVYSMTATHVPTLLAGSGLSNRLPAIVMGGDGNLYVGDVANSVILQVTLSGGVTTVAGSPALPIATVLGGLPAKINSPSGLALLSQGSPVSLAVVDSFEHAILRVDLP